MGRAGSAVEAPEKRDPSRRATNAWTERYPSSTPRGWRMKAGEVRDYLAEGYSALSGILSVEPPGIAALLVADEDWRDAPRDNARPYPPGLPYFTRSVEPPALVLPEELSPVFRPRTAATLPLTSGTSWPTPSCSAGGRQDPGLARGARPASRLGGDRKKGRICRWRTSVTDRQEPGFTVRSFRGRRGRGIRCRSRTCCSFWRRRRWRSSARASWTHLPRPLGRRRDSRRGAGRGVARGRLGPGGREWLASRPEF